MIAEDALARAQLVERESGERLVTVLTRLGLVPEARLAEVLAQATRLPLASPADLAQAVVPEALSIAFLRESLCLPLALGAVPLVAVADPFDAFVPEALAFALGRPIARVVAAASDIDAALTRLDRGDGDESALDEAVDGDDLERMRDLVSDAPVIRAVNRLIAEASDLRASDIHVEPTEDRLSVRFRVDGVLRDMPALPPAMKAPLVSRIKVMAGLNIAEKRLPQDGRLRLAVRGRDIDLRVATAPSIHGESVVMRILDRGKLALDFSSLGFDARLTEAMRTAIHKPHGIVLVTGPTGSGKTTTLYAALAELNRPERKLLTVEDPIEYRLPGVIQTQVNPGIGFTFSAALRSFLRQDPDVMMVGEIRDSDTAEIAVQAALTGHMILATLHTNSAAGAVTRLIDMKVEPFLLASVLTGVLAQRLVRRLCPDCRIPYAPDPVTLEQHAPGMVPPPLLYHPGGCARCNGSGYAGRLALLEFLPVTDAVAKLILASADARAIAAAAGSDFRSLFADGIDKAGQGLTSLEEVLRVDSAD
ncbi:type II secretion system protein GspE [alpha proteobacterium AAP81b]|nr:type II secretion system protein GspE [alpha proteobacterium AAP81b]